MEVLDVSEDQEEALALSIEELLGYEKKLGRYRLDYRPERRSLVIRFDNRQDEERILKEVQQVKLDDNNTFNVRRYTEDVPVVTEGTHEHQFVEVLDVTDEDFVLEYFVTLIGRQMILKYNKAQSTMILSLENQPEVEKVLSKGVHEIADYGTVRVRKFQSTAKGSNEHQFVEVLDVTDEDFVREYFVTLIGRQMVLKYNKEQSTMILSLENQSEMEKVLSKDVHEIADYGTIRVRKLQSTAKGLKVSGIPAGVSEKYLSSYFKSDKSGGGNIKTLKWEPDSGTATIFYLDDSVAQRVCNKRGHEIRGTALTLELIEEQLTDTQPDPRPKRKRHGILVSGIPEGISEKYLVTHFKKAEKGGGPIKKTMYDVQGRQAKLFFEEDKVALTAAAKSHKLRDISVTVLRIEEDEEEEEKKEEGESPTTVADDSNNVVDTALEATVAGTSLTSTTLVLCNLTTFRRTHALDREIAKKWKLQAGDYDELCFNPSLCTGTVTLTTTSAKLQSILKLPLDKDSTVEVCASDPKSVLGDIHVLIDRVSAETSQEALWCWTKVVIGRYPHTIFYSRVFPDNCIKAVALITFTPDLDIDQCMEEASRDCYKIDCQALSTKIIGAPLQIQVSNVTSRSELAIKNELERLLGDDGDSITDVLLEGNTAIVTFDSRKAHAKVLSQQSMLEGRKVFPYYEQLGIITEQQLVHYDEIARMIGADIPSDVIKQQVLPRLQVTGFEGKIRPILLEKFFRDRSKSGGDKSASLSPCKDGAVLTFDNPNAADRVFQKYKAEGLKISNCSLSVTIKGMRDISGSALNQVLVRNVGQASEDSIKFFLWGLIDTSVRQLTFVKDPEDQCLCALVRFVKNIDRYLLAWRLRAVTLDSSFLEVEPVKLQLALILSNVPVDADRVMVELCFESDQLEQCLRQRPGVWMVIFKDHAYADQAYSSVIKYNDEIELSAEYHTDYTPVANARDRGKRGQKVVQLDAIPPEITGFVHKHRGRDFDKLLGDTGCAYKAGESGRLSIFLSSSTAKSQTSEERWQRTEEAFLSFFNSYEACQVDLLPALWDDIVESKEFKAVQRYGKDVLELRVLDADSAGSLRRITMVGEKATVQLAREQILEVVRSVNEERERQKQRTSHTEKLSTWLSRVLAAQDICAKLQGRYKELVVELDLSRAEIRLDGFPADIKGALDEISGLDKASTEEDFDVSAIVTTFMQRESIEAAIRKKLGDANLAASVTWWIPHAGSVHVRGLNPEATQEAVRIIRSEISETVVELGEGVDSIVRNDKWRDCADAIIGRRGGDVVIAEEVDACRLRLVCKASDSAPILEEINNFTRKNLIKKAFLPVFKEIMQLLTTTLKSEVLALERTQTHNHVRLLPHMPERGKCGYHVEGNIDGIANIKRIVTEFISKKQKLTTKQHTVKAPGAASHFRDHQGTLQRIGKESGTYIEVFDPTVQEEELDVEEGNVAAVGGTSLPGGVLLTILKADITQLDCDVIVNPANEKLEHIGGLARVLANAGGPEIQRESEEYISRCGQLPEGQACATSAGKGKLRCKRIVHAVGPRWQGGSRNEVNKLFQAVQNSLFLVEQEKLSSVAFPPISSGIFGYPLDKCTATIVESIAAYCEAKQGSLTRVVLVDVNDDGVTYFKRALDGYLGKGSSNGSYRQDSRLSPPKQAKAFSQERSLSHREQRTSVLFGGINIELLKENLVAQEVDAIVSTIGQDLDLSKGVLSRIVLEHAGDNLQQQLLSTYSPPMPLGEVAVTGGCKLRCKHVFHACCPRFDPGADGLQIQRLVTECLTEAEKRKLSSIALPALGTGNLGHSKETVVEQMYNAVELFGVSGRVSTLKTVKFVMPTDDLYTVFQTRHGTLTSATVALQKTQADSNVKGRMEAFRYEELAAKEAASPRRAPVPVDCLPSAGPKKKLEVGGVNIHVVCGDITDEASIIVNSTDSNLSLNSQVAKALCRKGGYRIAEECKKKKHIKGEGVFLAGPGDLNCDHILHVDSNVELAEVITKCLQKAGEVQAKSISFPAIGTGAKGQSAADVAPILLEAISRFVTTTRCPYLKDIRFVIVDDTMAQDFQNALERAFTTVRPSLMSRIGGYLKATTSNLISNISGGTGAGALPRARAPIESLDSMDDASDDEDVASEILLTICGSEENIKSAISLLDQHCTGAEHAEDLCEPPDVICQLTDDEVRKMSRYGDKVGVAIDVDRAAGVISLRSLNDATLLRARAVITKHLYGQRITHLDKTISDLGQRVTEFQEENISSRVQWQYREMQSSEWLNYPKLLNAKLEQVHGNGQPCLKYGPSHNRYTVDLTASRDSSESQKDADASVRRRDLSLGLPNEWKSNPEYFEEVLDPNSREYQDVEKEFTSTLAGTSFKVLEIKRVQNPQMYHQYLQQKERVKAGMSPNCNLPVERKLWHGTNEETLPFICHGGFNRSYCGKNDATLGQGVLFSKDSARSAKDVSSVPNAQKEKFVVLCLVLTGEYEVGKPDMRVTNKKPAVPLVSYETTVDSTVNPSVFVTYHDAQAYPSYVIKFTASN